MARRSQRRLDEKCDWPGVLSDHWYNRKQLLIEGVGCPYLRSADEWDPIFAVCFFSLIYKGKMYVYDDEGTRYSSIITCTESLIERYEIEEVTAVSVAYQHTPLGEIPTKDLPKRRRRK